MFDHIQHVRQVLQHLLENHLCEKREKCKYHASIILFLWFIIAKGEVKMDPEKVKAVLEWPVPDRQKQLQCIFGFARFYRCFIGNYSKMAAPLTTLSFTSRQFTWSLEAEAAFLELKTWFTAVPVLCPPDPAR